MELTIIDEWVLGGEGDFGLCARVSVSISLRQRGKLPMSNGNRVNLTLNDKVTIWEFVPRAVRTTAAFQIKKKQDASNTLAR